jgi:hypothetical protein
VDHAGELRQRCYDWTQYVTAANSSLSQSATLCARCIFEVACCIAHGCARSITKFLDTEIDRSLVRLHVPPPGLSMSALMGRSSCPLHACKPYQACSLLQRIVVPMAWFSVHCLHSGRVRVR